MSRMQDKINLPCTNVYAGIDVAKDWLDVYIHPLNTKHRFANDRSGISKLVKQCARDHVDPIALEATGKYHRQAHQMLHEADFNVAVINPYRSRKFADVLGQLAKTDTIDAQVLAHFAAIIKPQPSLPPSPHRKVLRDLNVARRQVVDEIGTLNRQLSSTDHPFAARQLRARVKMCERHKDALENEIQHLIKTQVDLRHRFEILTSIPGIGVVTATTLLSDLDELGQVNCKEIAALAGVAPMNRDSGIMRGKRTIRGGRPQVRHLLYMCAVSSSQRDSLMGNFYRRLVKQGKHPKVALTAVARKLVVIANTLITENRHWQTAHP